MKRTHFIALLFGWALQVLGEKIEAIDVSQKFNVKVVGIYGVGGIGKTTICMTLCNELSSEYEGRVCHVVFESVPGFKYEECFQKVLRDLMKNSVEAIQQFNEGQVRFLVSML